MQFFKSTKRKGHSKEVKKYIQTNKMINKWNAWKDYGMSSKSYRCIRSGQMGDQKTDHE